MPGRTWIELAWGKALHMQISDEKDPWGGYVVNLFPCVALFFDHLVIGQSSVHIRSLTSVAFQVRRNSPGPTPMISRTDVSLRLAEPI
jgi:hypothetical protein